MNIRLKKQSWIVVLFFVGFGMAGVCVHKDYGMAMDEPIIRSYGIVVWNHIFHGDAKLLTYGDRFHGPVFEVILVGAEKLFRLTDPYEIYPFRHLITFLFFWCGAIVFYLLCLSHFGDWKFGLLGAAFLAVSPRIFAHAFFNSKDMAFLSAFIIAVYTLTRYLDNKELRWLIAHGISSGLCMDFRVTGLLVPVLTSVFLAHDFLSRKTVVEGGKVGFRNRAFDFPVYAALTFVTVVVFWPTLWKDPFMGMLRALHQMNRFPHYSDMLFFGRFFPPGRLPWYYVPGWIAVSVPLLYVVLAMIGAFGCFCTVARKPRVLMTVERNRMIILFWFAVPWIAVLVLRSVIFDEWRHLFFIYPALILLALYGLRSVSVAISRFSSGWRRNVLRGAVALLVAFGVGEPAWFMVRSHPHEYVYFNQLVGGVRGAVDRFDLDYWGVAYRPILEKIVYSDARPLIKVHTANQFGALNADMLPEKSRSRLQYANDPEQADYVITNFRWVKRSAYVGRTPVFDIRVDGVPIAVAYGNR